MGKNDEIALQNNFESYSHNRFPNPPKDFNVWEYYCVEQFARPFDLSDSELKVGIVGAGQDGGVDAFYILANGELVGSRLPISSALMKSRKQSSRLFYKSRMMRAVAQNGTS